MSPPEQLPRLRPEQYRRNGSGGVSPAAFEDDPLGSSGGLVLIVGTVVAVTAGLLGLGVWKLIELVGNAT